ncbi:MAG TPA: hypothetical protein PLP19_16545 [bacterium]|nr:hypothetical protein [bacterium]HPN45103.1 hypothetical protein [bacterium]
MKKTCVLRILDIKYFNSEKFPSSYKDMPPVHTSWNYKPVSETVVEQGCKRITKVNWAGHRVVPLLHLSGRIETNLYPTTGFRVNHIIAMTFMSWDK